MKQSAFATVALVASSALAASTGGATVVNSCTYDVHLSNVPAQGGGHEQEDKVLSPGDKWSQKWTQLTNGNGWSIKLSKSATLENIMQYEYTWHGDGIIWYDLSDVNGNPWDRNWEITADGSSCKPKQQAYRFSTDDAYGMQSCPEDSSITVRLCSGESQDDGAQSSIASSVATESAEPTSAAHTEAPSTPVASPTHHWGPPAQANVEVQSPTTKVTPTTFATSTTAFVEEAPGFTVIEVETAVVTEHVTAIYTAPAQAKRHEHHPAHHHA